MVIVFSLLLIVLSAVIIAKSCDGFEVAADHLGRNMSEGVKGASINAIGSSMPELLATAVFLFLFADTTGFAGGIGTTAGSSVFNTMVIPAFSILAAIKIFKISGVKVSKKVILRDGLMLIAAEFILIVTIGETLKWWHGMMLMLLYFAYVGYMFMSMKPEEKLVSADVNEEDNIDVLDVNISKNRLWAFVTLDLEGAVIGARDIKTSSSVVLLLISTAVIAVACYILVYGCEVFGHAIGIHGYFVAVILAAAASSVPDTILSVKDAKKGNYDDAVSNALGSNIFDICFALGLPLFLYTLIYGPITIPDMVSNDIAELRVILLVLTIIAFFVFLFGEALGKAKAYLLLGMYGVFVVFIVSSAYDLIWIQPISSIVKSLMSII